MSAEHLTKVLKLTALEAGIEALSEYGKGPQALGALTILQDMAEELKLSASPTPPDREDLMVTLEFSNGLPKAWCDPEIADLVKALNDGGIQTIASCSGHGHRPGSIVLKDGRELLIMTFDEARQVDPLFPIDINGDHIHPPEAQGESGWISVEDRLPDNDKDVWICDGEFIEIGNLFRGHLWNTAGKDIHSPSHWMPLNKPRVLIPSIEQREG